MAISYVSIPSRGFWFFEGQCGQHVQLASVVKFQSPRGDFGFLKVGEQGRGRRIGVVRFNPLAGILVF